MPVVSQTPSIIPPLFPTKNVDKHSKKAATLSAATLLYLTFHKMLTTVCTEMGRRERSQGTTTPPPTIQTTYNLDLSLQNPQSPTPYLQIRPRIPTHSPKFHPITDTFQMLLWLLKRTETKDIDIDLLATFIEGKSLPPSPIHSSTFPSPFPTPQPTTHPPNHRRNPKSHPRTHLPPPRRSKAHVRHWRRG